MRSNPNYNVIKEPRGFIKCLQIFLAIFAFSCATGFRGDISIVQTNTQSHTAKGTFRYPFDGGIPMTLTSNLNNSKAMQEVVAPLSERAKTEFFVVIGVFCFLYSVGMLIYYVLFEEDSTQNSTPSSNLLSPPVIDFALGAFWTLFWFFSACAFAAAVSNISDAADTDKLIKGEFKGFCGSAIPNISCSGKSAKTATLTVAILLGFLNVFVWAGNIWFLWKETPWHNKTAQPATIPNITPQQQTPSAAAI